MARNPEFYNFSINTLEPAICSELNKLYGSTICFTHGSDYDDTKSKVDIWIKPLEQNSLQLSIGSTHGLDVKTIEPVNNRGAWTNFSFNKQTFSAPAKDFLLFAYPTEKQLHCLYDCYLCKVSDVQQLKMRDMGNYYLCPLSEIKTVALKTFSLSV
jgi:hypothetical protein